MRRLFLKLASAGAVGALVGACGGTDSGDDESPGTMIDVAFRSGEISALVAAAERAGLTSALAADDANLTVLAPTNGAWAALSGQLGFRSIQEMIDALPAATVEAILRYHVLPARLSKADLLAGGPSQPTLLQQNSATVSLPLALTTSNELRTNDMIGRVAFVDVFDIPADNGVFHIIDKVLLPTGLLTVLQTVQSDPQRFLELVDKVGRLPPPNEVAAALGGSAPVTLFAPVNEAFRVPAVRTLIDSLERPALSTALRYHALGSAVPSSAIVSGAPVATLAGQNITITLGGTAIARIDDTTATDANITQVDILCTNGVVHVIDKVLLPTLS